jgi:hypothetical protein
MIDPVERAYAELAAAESRLTGARLHLEQILPRYHRSTAGAFAETYYVPRRLMERRLRDMAVENSAALKAALAKRADNNDERDPNPMPDDAPGPADKGDDESPSKPKDKSKKTKKAKPEDLDEDNEASDQDVEDMEAKAWVRTGGHVGSYTAYVKSSARAILAAGRARRAGTQARGCRRPDRRRG